MVDAVISQTRLIRLSVFWVLSVSDVFPTLLDTDSQLHASAYFS